MGSLPRIVEDCMGFLQLYSDGSIYRNNDIKFKDSVVEDQPVIFKDSLFHKSFDLYLRIFKPQPSSGSEITKRPLVMFFHGGGFCFGSRTWPHVHNCCVRLASRLRVVVAAPDYRLAPEHRLPAALDDAVEAVRWVQRVASSTGEDYAWLNGYVDFDRVFIVGDSSGGNIAHHLAVRFGSEARDLDPIRVRGYVLLAPFFGGEARTNSEEGPPEEVLSIEMLDRFWRLSMPVGKNRDHPLANPFGPESPDPAQVKLDPILVMVGGRELLKDRAKDYAEKLKELGKNIEYVEFEGREHGFFSHDSYSDVAEEALQIIQRFLLRNSA
ncbi:probable carboxylesterase 15 [Neltuma alba]|uniref:probable carboxylesterase 15 n=1 Tax=Neltuma alba TaxID=207710 RepID=UPI0010A5812D|nr:probable carboxylesterase 15 [Prosopis alba]